MEVTWYRYFPMEGVSLQSAKAPNEPQKQDGLRDWSDLDGDVARRLAPSLFKLNCLQCDAQFTATIYHSPHGVSLAILPKQYGGTATTHTPKEVAFYLDQAARAHSVGANSAAIAMFRSALEWLLHEQGYKNGMLGPKLQELESAIANGNAPQWAMRIENDFLDVMKKLGNQAVHTNNGDITKQDGLDEKLYSKMEHTFAELIDLVYEEPFNRQARLAALQQPLT